MSADNASRRKRQRSAAEALFALGQLFLLDGAEILLNGF